MKKLIVTILLLFIFFPCVAFALQTESRLVETAVGNPPPEAFGGGPAPTEKLASILHWGKQINSALQPGLPSTSWNRMLSNISNGTYTATIRQALDRGVSQSGIYWCTNLVIDAFNLAGITGLGPNHQGVRSMVDFWKKAPGYVFIPNNGINSLKLAKPGFALFRINPTDYEYDHASLIESIFVDDEGNGSIKTLDSNGKKSWSSPIVKGRFTDTSFLSPVIGFGGIVGSEPKIASGTKPVIVLDPGHSGSDIDSIDPATGLRDHDYPNTPELQEMFTVAQKVKSKLEADGYTVIMTKNSVNENVSLRKRAEIANNANANLAVSIHDDHGANWNTFAQVYIQKDGLYRETNQGKRVIFNNPAVAQKSQTYGQNIAQARSIAEGRPVSVTGISFVGRSGLDPGNIPMVQLFAKVPWVYNEVGTDGNSPLSETKLDQYAQGIINGIEKSVPIQ